MNEKHLNEHLEELREQLTEEEFSSFLWEKLDEASSPEEKDLFESWLLINATKDSDRLARYLEPFLHSSDTTRREVAVMRLATLSTRGRDSLAYRLLTDFLGQEPLQEKLPQIMKERIHRLQSRKSGKE